MTGEGILDRLMQALRRPIEPGQYASTPSGDPGPARQATFDYIEVFYNRERRHSGLGFLTPAPAYTQMVMVEVA